MKIEKGSEDYDTGDRQANFGAKSLEPPRLVPTRLGDATRETSAGLPRGGVSTRGGEGAKGLMGPGFSGGVRKLLADTDGSEFRRAGTRSQRAAYSKHKTTTTHRVSYASTCVKKRGIFARGQVRLLYCG